jgi:D-beta-D-heptose 7-phosphate kinase/D-beta-D-heptose 1-phosphate adenosyltransferase
VFGSEEELRDSIQMYSPEVIVVGSEYKFKDVIGKEYSKNVSFFERVEGYSTSSILGGENE